ncbi:MAG: hypothetical protein PF692_14820 [Kiritimatiellae bacterium]|jgi:hypothetical protein|nr:hypothetical protein [Kiritimatiellia bacterium]
MSRALRMDSVNCKPISRPGHVEYSLEYHASIVWKIKGVDTDAGAVSQHAIYADDGSNQHAPAGCHFTQSEVLKFDNMKEKLNG